MTQEDIHGKFEKKIKNCFYDPTGKKSINGYPTPENPDDMDSDDWKVFYIQARKFLVKYCEESVIPKLKGMAVPAAPASKVAEHDAAIDEAFGGSTPDGQPNPDEIPF